MRVISQQLRDSARGEECTLRLSRCLHTTDTTVLAHLPCGQKGTSMKGPDIMAVYACYFCHLEIDGEDRWKIPAFDYLRALAETQMAMIRKGLITVKGMKK